MKTILNTFTIDEMKAPFNDPWTCSNDASIIVGCPIIIRNRMRIVLKI